MGVAKYSPTVSRWYDADQDWWNKNGGNEVRINYDKDGYDSYGYNDKDVDRAGNHENAYADSIVFDDNDVYSYPLYDDTYDDWVNQPVPTKDA